MTLDNLISQLQDIRKANGNIEVQLLDMYAAKQRKSKTSFFANEIHLSYAKEEKEKPPAAEMTNPIGFV